MCNLAPASLPVLSICTILGGIVTTIGDTVIDGSVRTRLDQLKNAI